MNVLSVAAHAVSDTWKFDCGLKRTLHAELHWLDASQHIRYKLSVITVMSEYCSSVSDGSLYTSLDDCIKAASSFICQSSAESTIILGQRSSSFCYRWSNNVEVTAKTLNATLVTALLVLFLH